MAYQKNTKFIYNNDPTNNCTMHLGLLKGCSRERYNDCCPSKIIFTKGFPPSFATRVYAGYLDVRNANRSLHYVFV